MSRDIERGALWFSEINDQLKDTKIGIVCLTKDNLDKPWILFEAGALAKGLSTVRVCTFLVDLEPTEVSNPLAQFNHTLPTKEGLFGLMRTLNASLGDQALKEKVLEQVFTTYWPQFEEKFAKALADCPAGEHAAPRSEESMLSELLRTVRMLERNMRIGEGRKATGPSVATAERIPISRRALRNEIREMLVAGLSPDSIESILEGSAPARFVRQGILECIEETVPQFELPNEG